MNKFYLLFLFVLLSTIVNAQTQKDYLKTHTGKGNTMIGIAGSVSNFAQFTQGRSYLRMQFRPNLNFQYNILNRLSIGGGIGTEIELAYNSTNQENFNPQTLSLRGRVFLQYHPFKSNGIFIEGDLIRRYYFGQFRIARFDYIGLNPGYTFMIGKNKNIGLDLKMRIQYFQKSISIQAIPIMGVKIPIGQSAKKQNGDIKG